MTRNYMTIFLIGPKGNSKQKDQNDYNDGTTFKINTESGISGGYISLSYNQILDILILCILLLINSSLILTTE